MKTKTLSVITVMLLLTSCKAMKGEMTVHENLSLNKKKSIFSKKIIKVKVPAGEYKAVIKGTKSKIKIKVEDVGKKSPTFVFKIDESVKIPTSNGDIKIAATKTGQPYDLGVKVDTDSDSSSYDTTQSCVKYYRTETRCHWVSSSTSCSETGGGEVCRTTPGGEERCYTRPTETSCHTTPGYNSCSDVSIPVYGTEPVTVTNTTTTRNVVSELLKGETIMATFTHTKVSNSTYRSAFGSCY